MKILYAKRDRTENYTSNIRIVKKLMKPLDIKYTQPIEGP
jgi:hypothetical protein